MIPPPDPFDEWLTTHNSTATAEQLAEICFCVHPIRVMFPEAEYGVKRGRLEPAAPVRCRYCQTDYHVVTVGWGPLLWVFGLEGYELVICRT